MTLQEINMPSERRRIIRYGRDGNKVVHRWHDVQQVKGPLYMGNFRDDRYHQPLFDLFIIFPEVKDGLFYACMTHPNRYTPEKLMETAKVVGVDSKEAYAKSLEELMARDIHIGNAMIEFVRQWDAPMAERCAAYRAARYARIEERDKLRRAEAEAEAAKRKAEAEALLKAEKNKYLGWADTMTAMRYGRVSKFLEKRVRINGAVMTRRDFVISLVRDGWRPKAEDGVTRWRKVCLEWKKSQPRTEYYLRREDLQYTISKTEFEFASYLTSHNVCCKESPSAPTQCSQKNHSCKSPLNRL